MLSLQQLTTPRTIPQMRQQLLDALQGRGVVTRTGTGTGMVTVSGSPTGLYSILLEIVVGGEPGGAATFRYSFDGGGTWSVAAAVPTAAVGISSTGVSVTFAPGPSGAGASFVAGDTFAFVTSTPTFPATSWQEGSVPRTLVEIQAQALADLTSLVAEIARSGFVTTEPGVTGARGGWLDLVAGSVYGLTRHVGVAAAGLVTLTDTAGAGPFVIAAGELWFVSTNGMRFVNTAGGTIPLGGSVQLAVQAESPGAAYNVANGSVTTLVTPLPGVTVANPDVGTGSWLTTQGSDVESDMALSTRCLGRWASLGYGSPAAAYDSWARTASAEITRTQVGASQTVAGQVDVHVAGASGPVSAGAVAAAQAYITPRTPVAVRAVVANTSVLGVTIAGTVNVSMTYLATAVPQVAQALQDLFQSIPIGGTVYLSAVISAIQEVAGVRNTTAVTLNGSAADVVLTAAQVATLTNSLTFVGF